MQRDGYDKPALNEVLDVEAVRQSYGQNRIEECHFRRCCTRCMALFTVCLSIFTVTPLLSSAAPDLSECKGQKTISTYIGKDKNVHAEVVQCDGIPLSSDVGILPRQNNNVCGAQCSLPFYNYLP